MAGYDVVWMPFAVMYVLYMIPPTLMEVYAYYSRGGMVYYEDFKYDDTFTKSFIWAHDAEIYFKRFLDRPKSEASKAFYSWLDWSGMPYDHSLYILRRNHARGDKEVGFWKWYIYGPYMFNWPRKQWLRGDDAAGWLKPAWGDGGEERARAEFAEAEAKGYKKNWHYQIMRKIRREQALLAAQKKHDANGNSN